MFGQDKFVMPTKLKYQRYNSVKNPISKFTKIETKISKEYAKLRNKKNFKQIIDPVKVRKYKLEDHNDGKTNALELSQIQYAENTNQLDFVNTQLRKQDVQQEEEKIQDQ